MSKKSFIVISVFCALLAFWEFVARSSQELRFVLPPPSIVISTLFSSHDRLMHHAWMTCQEMAAGLTLAVTCAFPIAWIMQRFRTSRLLLQPVFIIIQCLPMFTLAPLMIIWFGWNFIAIVIPTALMIFFPLTLNIYHGIRATPSSLLDFFKVNGASDLQTLFKLRLPWALPHVFSGLKIASVISGIGAIAGEWAGAQEGLGILMLESRRNVDLELTFASLLCLTILSALFYGAIVLIEKISLKPRKKFQYKFLTFLTLLLSVTSCHQKQESSQTKLLLDWLPNPNHVPIYVGLKKGYFEEEGIHLVIQKMPDHGGGLSYLTSKQTDLLINHLPGMMKASSQGATLKIVGTLIKEPLSGFIYHQTNIHKASELSGKILGYCLGSPDTTFLDYLLKQGHIYPSRKVNIGIDLLTTMSAKKVDFIYGGFWNIEPFQLRTLNIETECFKLSEFGIPNYYEMIIVAQDGSPQSKPSFVAKFQRALQKSLNDCKSNPIEAFAIYQTYHPDKREKTFSWEKEAWNVTYPILASDQIIDHKMLMDFHDFLKENKMINHAFDYLKLIP